MESPLQYGLIGDPVSHSLSPLIHETLYEHYGITAQYHLYPVPADGIPGFIASLPALRLRGFNITMPHKRSIIPYLTRLDARARRMQSVNTVLIKDGRLMGYTTDGQGFSWALVKKGVRLAGQHVLIMGAGGAAGTVALECVLQSANSLTILNRTLQAAKDMAEWLGSDTSTVITIGSMDDLADHVRKTTLLINATPMGMQGHASDFADFSFLDLLPYGAVVNDLIYRPAQTSLLREAEKRGFLTANGLGMLIGQAMAAFTHFTGLIPDDSALRDVVNALELANPHT